MTRPRLLPIKLQKRQRRQPPTSQTSRNKHTTTCEHRQHRQQPNSNTQPASTHPTEHCGQRVDRLLGYYCCCVCVLRVQYSMQRMSATSRGPAYSFRLGVHGQLTQHHRTAPAPRQCSVGATLASDLPQLISLSCCFSPLRTSTRTIATRPSAPSATNKSLRPSLHPPSSAPTATHRPWCRPVMPVCTSAMQRATQRSSLSALVRPPKSKSSTCRPRLRPSTGKQHTA